MASHSSLSGGGVGGGAERGSVDYVCELCEVHTTSHHDIQGHFRGRPHMDMVQRSEVAQRSVYLRGFPNVATVEEDLRGIMGQFGGVVSLVVMASSEDAYALVEFSSRDAALHALKHSSPLTLHAHTLTVKPRLLKPGRPARRRVRQGRKHRLDVGIVTADTDPGTERCSVRGKLEGRSEDGEVEGRSEDDEVEVIGGIHFTPEALSAISSAHAVNTQLEAIALHCRHSSTVAELQLALAWRLQNRLCKLMPPCMVVPFGAPFSGHGTVSSDCDLCVLTKPHPLEVAMFSGPAYLSQHLQAVWEQLQTTPSDPLDPTIYGHVEEHPEMDRSFDLVLATVQGDQHCSRVLPLRHAHCPIIRFLYQPGQLHCDLSVNNRLGLANTRLLAAYMNFNPRMAILVPCVRLWARGWGIKRSIVNSYALSLMLIHSLQHTSPPVLPCLQDPGVWPKNMPWIGGRGFSAADEQHVELDGWDCSFIDPLSLLPSSNPASPAQLFLHFLHYYAEVFSFSEQAIAIHTLSLPLISHLRHDPSGQGMGFKVSSLCLQDPFERSHNVTKNLKAPHLPQLLHAFQSSLKILKELLEGEQIAPGTRQNVLSLFKPTESAIPRKKAAAVHTLHLDTGTVCRLLCGTRYAALAGRLEELDLNNTFIQWTLNHVILQSLAVQLEREFGFRVHAESPAASSISPASSLPPTNIAVADGSAHQCKRQRKEVEGEVSSEEGMEVEEEGLVEVGGEQGVKRKRLAEQESAEQLLFRLTEGEWSGCTLVCSAMEESWIHRRRRRREKQKQASCSPSNTVEQGATASSLSGPCLSFTLTSPSNPSPGNHLAVVVLHATDSKFQHHFQQFFAVCKKWLLSTSP